jgi:hypothetical protein
MFFSLLLAVVRDGAEKLDENPTVATAGAETNRFSYTTMHISELQMANVGFSFGVVTVLQ